MLVTSAMMTRETNTFSLIKPFSRATNPKIISMAPRAFMPNAAASDSRQVNPPRRVPHPLPIIFHAKAITIMMKVKRRSKFVAKFTLSPMETKNKGAKMLLINW